MDATIIIGDVHGLTFWKKSVNDNPDCRYVFLGDYLDPYKLILKQALLSNLEEIIQLKKDNPENVVLLFGNHDLHYCSTDIGRSTRYDFGLVREASELFLDNIHLFQYAYQQENTIFVHAGISHKWFVEDFNDDLNSNIAQQLNNPQPEQIAVLFRCGESRGGRMGCLGGIFWADVKELDKPLQGYTQIVGHNRVPDVVEHCKDGGKIIFCDCLWNEHYLKI